MKNDEYVIRSRAISLAKKAEKNFDKETMEYAIELLLDIGDTETANRLQTIMDNWPE